MPSIVTRICQTRSTLFLVAHRGRPLTRYDRVAKSCGAWKVWAKLEVRASPGRGEGRQTKSPARGDGASFWSSVAITALAGALSRHAHLSTPCREVGFSVGATSRKKSRRGAGLSRSHQRACRVATTGKPAPTQYHSRCTARGLRRFPRLKSPLAGAQSAPALGRAYFVGGTNM
jgi:hypothetical protein